MRLLLATIIILLLGGMACDKTIREVRAPAAGVIERLRQVAASGAAHAAPV